MTIGERMKATRKKAKITKQKLSELTGISTRSIYAYEENGIEPRKKSVEKVAKALNVTSAYLYGYANEDLSLGPETSRFLVAIGKTLSASKARNAAITLERTGALLAGGDLDDESKELFIKSLFEVVELSKIEAQRVYTRKKYRKKSKEKV